MDDLIGRQDAIDAINELTEFYEKNKYEEEAHATRLCQGAIRNLPSAQPKERYINADELIKRLEQAGLDDAKKIVIKMAEHERLKASTRPTVDAVEVVRCKDCKYQDKSENELESRNLCGLRPWLHVPIDDYHFCAAGEKSDGQE